MNVCLQGFAVAVEDAVEDEIDGSDPEATATTDEDTESKVSGRISHIAIGLSDMLHNSSAYGLYRIF